MRSATESQRSRERMNSNLRQTAISAGDNYTIKITLRPLRKTSRALRLKYMN